MKPTADIVDFYLKMVRGNTEGMVSKISEANGIALAPSKPSDFKPLPVYEDGSAMSLLTQANSRFVKTTIEWPAADFPYLQAYWKRYKDDRGVIRNEIVVLTDNYCWARFYAAKELMHCLIDDDGYSAAGTFELVNDLLESLSVVGRAPVDFQKPATIVDEMAWLGAAEYLVPTAWLPRLAQLSEELAAKYANPYLHIAQLIRAPELVIRWRLKVKK